MRKSSKTLTKTNNSRSVLDHLIVKDVDLFGDTVVAAQDSEGIVWAGVPWFCKGMGLTKDQTRNERKKIQEDLVLSQGVKFHPLGTGNANKEVLCLQLDYIPLWLAKISITPNMKETNPELVEKLVKYQLKAKDVLAAAFLPETNNSGINKKYDYPSESIQFTDNPYVLSFHNKPVITTVELAKHYGVSCQNILTTFYKNRNYFEKEEHYFLFEVNEEIKFRKTNGLNTNTKLYLWTRKGSLMFTKIINNELGWEQYKKILDILFQKIYGEEEEVYNKPKEIETDNMQQISERTGQLKLQNNWYLKNAYKIERICKALDISIKEFNHLVISKIQEKYDMKSIGSMYKDMNGSSPEYALDIIGFSLNYQRSQMIY